MYITYLLCSLNKGEKVYDKNKIIKWYIVVLIQLALTMTTALKISLNIFKMQNLYVMKKNKDIFTYLYME